MKMAPNNLKNNLSTNNSSGESGGGGVGSSVNNTSIENNSTSSIDFWNSPDYFKLYDDIGVWNQTFIINQTTSPSTTTVNLSSLSSTDKLLPSGSYFSNNNNFSIDNDQQQQSNNGFLLAADDKIALINSAEKLGNTQQHNDAVAVGGDYFIGGGIGENDDGDSNIIGSSSNIGSSNNAGNHFENYLNQNNETTNGLYSNIGGGISGGIHPNYDGDGGGGGGNGGNNGGSNFMLLLEDFGEYFYNYNNNSGGVGGSNSVNGGNSVITIGATSSTNVNYTDFDFRTNCSAVNSTCTVETIEDHYNYWALLLIIFPILTLFGNILVILSVCRERTLQSATNYFIVSLAIADLLVAIVVMPFGVYVLFNGGWYLPNFVCDFYIAMDVICSTSSIFNLVAISIDRYIAVTQPIKYAKHKNSRRVCLTILLVWAISAAIGSPIVLGLNNTPNREPDLCIFYNTDFIVYSSLSSFYIPCIIMVFLYWNIFKALRHRARKQRAARKPNLSDIGTGGSVIENLPQTRRLAETTLDSTIRGVGVVCTSGSRIMPDEQATNTASGSNEEDDENAISPEDIDDCHVIANDKSTEFMLATVVEETGNVVAQITSTPQLIVADPNGNHDSGYAPSNIDDVITGNSTQTQTPPDSPMPGGGSGGGGTSGSGGGVSEHSTKKKNLNNKRNGVETNGSSPKREPLSVAMKPLSFVRYGLQSGGGGTGGGGASSLARNDSTISSISKASRKDKKNSQTSRFTLYKVHKASKKKREKSSAKKERKATKTLAIVLGVFLICWVPFFTCNIMDAMCTKLGKDCQPGVTAFILTTWLGYMNSFVNPVIYTIFNPEFRKAFKKIMHMV